MEIAALSLLDGIVYGLLLFLLASGLTLIFSMMGVLNFAHASFFMLGAYAAYEISRLAGFWWGLIIAPVVVGLFGALVERYGLRRVHRLGHVAELLFTFGLAFVIFEGVQLAWGPLPVPYALPALFDGEVVHPFSIPYPAYRLFMLVVSVAVFVALYGVLVRTRLGLVVRAALTHPDMTAALGHDVPRTFTLVFGLGCALAALAGVIAGNVLGTEPSMASTLGTLVFVVVVVGGLGSLTGALIGALVIGIGQTAMVALDVSLNDIVALIAPGARAATLAGEIWSAGLSTFAPLFPYLLMVLVLVLRPRGLMGTR